MQLENNQVRFFSGDECNFRPRFENLDLEVDLHVDVVRLDIDERPLGLRLDSDGRKQEER